MWWRSWKDWSWLTSHLKWVHFCPPCSWHWWSSNLFTADGQIPFGLHEHHSDHIFFYFSCACNDGQEEEYRDLVNNFVEWYWTIYSSVWTRPRRWLSISGGRGPQPDQHTSWDKEELCTGRGCADSTFWGNSHPLMFAARCWRSRLLLRVLSPLPQYVGEAA